MGFLDLFSRISKHRDRAQEAAEPTVVEEDTVLDADAALLWQRAHNPTRMSQQEAIDYCDSLQLAGSSQWFLPDLSHFTELRENIDVLNSLSRTGDLCWTSNRPDWDSKRLGYASDGTSFDQTEKFLVRAVRLPPVETAGQTWGVTLANLLRQLPIVNEKTVLEKWKNIDPDSEIEALSKVNGIKAVISEARSYTASNNKSFRELKRTAKVRPIRGIVALIATYRWSQGRTVDDRSVELFGVPGWGTSTYLACRLADDDYFNHEVEGNAATKSTVRMR